MICVSWRARGAVALIALVGGLIVGASSVDAPKATVGPTIEPVRGQFVSEGVAIEEFHCAPKTEGRHPVVMLLHGCAPTNFGVAEFQQMCVGLARRGYYAMFIDYYGPLGAPNCSDLAMLPGTTTLAPQTEIPDATWMHELLSASNSLAKEPKADPARIGVVGFSFGGTLAIITAALSPNVIKAIVDYYGFSNGKIETAVAQAPDFPPTLILQGDADGRAHVADSIHLHNVIAKHQPTTEIRVYPGVEHGFNFRAAPGYDEEASEDAWSRALSFLDRHLK